MKSAWHKIKKHSFLVSIAILAVAAGVFYFLRSPGTDSAPATAEVVRGTLIQEVSVTGKTVPLTEVELAFEKAGRVVKIYADVGDKAASGNPLVDLDKSELAAQLLEAEANVAAQQAKLDELLRGPRPEDIQTKRTELSKAQQDLQNDYTGASDVVYDAYIKSDDAVRKQIDDLFGNDEQPNVQLSFSISDSQLQINVQLQRARASTELETWLAELSGPMPAVSALLLAQGHLNFLRDFLNNLMQATLNTISVSAETLSAYRASINTARTSVNTALTNVNTQLQTIASQELTVQTKQDELNKLLAGSDPEAINAQKALLAQAKASQAVIETQLRKTTLYAPMDGVITRQDAKVGQVVAANSVLVGIISSNRLQVEANVPEADVAKIQTGDPVRITLDAYGDDVVFNAKVVKIDPGETVIEGVSTYKTTIQFLQEDARIKPGMTANADIVTETRANVLYVPQRSVLTRNGEKYAVLYRDGRRQEAMIQTGLRGSDGNVEILSGLEEGEKVLRSP